VPETSLRNKALDFLARREYSVKELRNKISKYSDNSEEVGDVISELIKNNLLSDERYAQAVIQQKYQSGYGPNHIEMYLREKGIEQELFNMHSDEFDWVESCKDLAKKKLRSKLPEGKEKEKILRYLSYRGFNYEIIKSALNNLD